MGTWIVATDKKNIIFSGGWIIGLAYDFEARGLLTAYLPPKAHEECHGANACHGPFGLGYKRTVLGAAEYMRNPSPPLS